MNGKIYVCTMTRKDAAELGMEGAYWESYNQNTECASAISKAISEGYDGCSIKADCAKEIIDRFGFQRVDFVLAYTISYLSFDGRISPANKEWAKENCILLVRCHAGLLDIFTDKVKAEQKSSFFTEGQWQELEGKNLEGRLLVLDIAQVRRNRPTADRQMFYCTEDCGDEVVGFFLKDKCGGRFQRSDFLGELKPEFTPAWVPDALEDMDCSPGQRQDAGMKMDF